MASQAVKHTFQHRNSSSNSDGNQQQMYCLICYKPASVTQQPIINNDQTEQTSKCDERINTFYKFYNNLVGTASQKLDEFYANPTSSTTTTMSTGACDDCFYAIELSCKISQEIECLQLKLKLQLSQLGRIMKCANKVPSRVKRFKESFHFQHQDDSGELVVTIRQGQMDKALQCRKNIYEACRQRLEAKQTESVTPNITDIATPSSSAETEISENDDSYENSRNSDSTTNSGSDEESETSDSPMTPSRTNVNRSNDKHKSQWSAFQCPKENCGKQHPNQESLNRHLKEHGKFPCQFCDFIADQARNLVDHETQLHWKVTTVPGKIQCPRCPRLLGPSKYDRAMHYFRAHLRLTGNGRARCKICGKIFKGWSSGDANYSLRNHLMTHSGVKPFKCTVCGTCVSSKSSLRRHVKRIHPEGGDILDELVGQSVVQTPSEIVKCEMELDSDGDDDLASINELLS